MRLEDFRGGRVADLALQVDGSAGMMPCAFHHHAQQAAWHTVNGILRFADEAQDGRVDEQIGVVEWWRTVESQISLLHLLSQDEHQAELRSSDRGPAKLDARIATKWASVSSWYSDGRQSAPAKLTGLLTDLRDFRNSFEHSSRTDERQRSHSRLAAKPAEANLADLMESVAICVAVCQWTRYLLPTADLMPQVWSPTADGGVVFAPLDKVAAECWFPVYSSTLQARGMTSDVEMYPEFGHIAGSAVRAARVLIRHEDERPLPPMTNTSAASQQVVDWGAKQPGQPSPTTFVLPDYRRMRE